MHLCLSCDKSYISSQCIVDFTFQYHIFNSIVFSNYILRQSVDEYAVVEQFSLMYELMDSDLLAPSYK